MTHAEPQTGATATTTGAAGDGEHVMDLLHEHVPLCLLVDLAEPGTPDSRTILEQEGEPDQHWWEHTAE